jgi:hypothetical protein
MLSLLEQSLKGAGTMGTRERADTVRAGMPIPLNAMSIEIHRYSKILIDQHRHIMKHVDSYSVLFVETP